MEILQVIKNICINKSKDRLKTCEVSPSLVTKTTMSGLGCFHVSLLCSNLSIYKRKIKESMCHSGWRERDLLSFKSPGMYLGSVKTVLGDGSAFKDLPHLWGSEFHPLHTWARNCLLSQHWGGGDRDIAEARWPVSLVRVCLKY